MPYPSLDPVSTLSYLVLPSTGSYSDVLPSLPFGIYGDPSSEMYSTDFITGAVEQVSYTYKMLGGDNLDLEITAGGVYAAYESAVLEYSYLILLAQAKNIMSSVLGSATGSFDANGTMKDGPLKTSLSGSQVALKYPKYKFAYGKTVMDTFSTEAQVGGSTTIYSASFDITIGQQDYDLEKIITTQSNYTASLEYSGKVGSKRINVTKVYYVTPSAQWRFFGLFGGAAVYGNGATYAGFGQTADNSTFEVIPPWMNKLQGAAFEDAIRVRCSHYSYELKNNKLRLFPCPVETIAPTKMWIEFSIPEDAWNTSESGDTAVDGVNNLNTIPFANIPYNNINSIGRNWIRRFCLALCKGILAQVRGKWNKIPIPGQDVTLNANELLTQSKEEQENLRKELTEMLEQLSYAEVVRRDAEIAESTQTVASKIPTLIYIG